MKRFYKGIPLGVAIALPLTGLLMATTAQAERHDWPPVVKDDPVLWSVRADRLELRDTDNGNEGIWEIEGWVGTDLHRAWIKTEGEAPDGNVEEAEVEFLYSRAIAAFWDLQVGWRHDFSIDDTPSRNWAAIGVQGLAPYRLEIDAFAYIGEQGRTAARLEMEYELPLTQRLHLMPGISLDAYGKSDPERELGSGLGTLGMELRLRYEIEREFAPYIGVRWDRKLGETADMARDEGGPVSDVQWLVGIQAWF